MPENGQVKAHRLVVQRGVFVGMSPIVNDDLYVEFRKAPVSGPGTELPWTRAHVSAPTPISGVSLPATGSGGRLSLRSRLRCGSRARVGSASGWLLRISPGIAVSSRPATDRGSSQVALTSPLDKFVDGGASGSRWILSTLR